MAKSPSERISELERNVLTQQQEIIHLRREVEEWKARSREGERAATATVQDVSGQKAKSDEQSKRLDELDRRLWALVVVGVTLATGLIVGLIVSLTRK